MPARRATGNEREYRWHRSGVLRHLSTHRQHLIMRLFVLMSWQENTHTHKAKNPGGGGVRRYLRRILLLLPPFLRTPVHMHDVLCVLVAKACGTKECLHINELGVLGHLNEYLVFCSRRGYPLSRTSDFSPASMLQSL